MVEETKVAETKAEETVPKAKYEELVRAYNILLTKAAQDYANRLNEEVLMEAAKQAQNKN